MKPDRVPLPQLADLVVDLDPRAPADEDVDLFLLLVGVPPGNAEAGSEAQVAQPRVLHPERDAGHARLDVAGQPEVGRLVVDVFLEVDVGVIAHGDDFPSLLHSMAMKALLL